MVILSVTGNKESLFYTTVPCVAGIKPIQWDKNSTDYIYPSWKKLYSHSRQKEAHYISKVEIFISADLSA